MNNKRLYTKIMQHLEKYGTGFWDFKTLEILHPKLALALKQIIIDAGILDSNADFNNYYIPRRLWHY